MSTISGDERYGLNIGFISAKCPHAIDQNGCEACLFLERIHKT